MGTCDPVKNFAICQVSTGYDASATSIVLTSGEGAKLPAPGTDGAFNLVWWNSTDYSNPADDPNREIVRVTARSTDTLTVTRGQEGVSATTKNTAGKTYKMGRFLTKLDYDNLASSLLGVKIGTITRDLTTASGTVSETGPGWQPRTVEFFCSVATGKVMTIGFSDGTIHRVIMTDDGTAADTFSNSTNYCIIAKIDGSNYQAATCTMTSNGFDLVWTKTGSPTGTLTVHYRALK